jgi:hypothetical protein
VGKARPARGQLADGNELVIAMARNEPERYDDPIAEARLALANPGMLGEQKLAQLGAAKIERRADPAPVVELSREEADERFLLGYTGSDEGLLWRKWQTERELARRQAKEEREAPPQQTVERVEARDVMSRIIRKEVNL